MKLITENYSLDFIGTQAIILIKKNDTLNNSLQVYMLLHSDTLS
jgi:hypothetical protein